MKYVMPVFMYLLVMVALACVVVDLWVSEKNTIWIQVGGTLMGVLIALWPFKNRWL